MSENIILKIRRVSDEFPTLPLPAYATQGSAGMDLCAALKEPYLIEKGSVALIPTNIAVEIPMGFELQVRPRSGLALKHGIGVLNSPGTIDSDYRGEIKVILFNFGKEDFTVNPGDRIAQVVISKVYTASVTEVNSLSDSKRGNGGFGHTGLESR
ncbi:MAG: dUTP diphosphatase [Ignavibacteria bacterium]|jgi:dUTP pyrophosphatase|nr:dUTP diphosphatase [Ignavibacteria bacterium]MCU7503111.1 dUTP diphosphatase [Ignavibacteria bacterium]MCU7516469.1 dUTP diphosphatase [Ignavibacteria bacterium]